MREAFRAALKADHPYEALRRTVVGLLEDGGEREVIIAELRQFRLDELQPPEREAQDDVVCDVLDLFHGWALPKFRL